MEKIEKLSDDQINQLSIGCPTLSLIPLGDIINIIIEAVNNQEACEYELISDMQDALNDMCIFNGIELGDLLQLIISATFGGIEIDELTIKQIKALNNTCGTLKGIGLGDKLNQIIIAVNTTEPKIHVKSIQIPQAITVNYGQSQVIDIVWNPNDAFDKGYSIEISDASKLTANYQSEDQITINPLVNSGEVTVTVIPNDGGSTKSATCTVTIVDTKEVKE